MKTLVCIECPKGCRLSAVVENGRVVSVAGNECRKGGLYARAEIENPLRVLTTTVPAAGLPLKLVPVRTDRPVPKGRIFEFLEAVGKIRVRGPVKCGDIILKDLLGTGINVIATRDAC